MAPAGIKAYPSSTNKILISWLPPIHRNGELTGYTFYMALRSGGKEVSNLLKKIIINKVTKFYTLCLHSLTFRKKRTKKSSKNQ